ncbi:MAG: SoxR reducing system RseC family protein [Clostridia bacterium]|nr:SoxR reducing system RseC family protein [Clostridia bacterium]
MRVRAKVIAIEGKYATVLCDRKSACEGCHKLADGVECSVCSLMGSGRSMQARAYNAAGAAVGDTVELETASSRVLGYAAMVFLLPIVMVIFGYLFSGLWTDLDAWRYLFCALLLVLTFVGVRLYSEKVQKKRTDVTVVAVVDPNEKIKINE